MKIRIFTTLSLLLFLSHFGISQTGIPVPQMANCDNLIMEFMNDYQIPGATVAIARNGKLVYMRGFGVADIAGNEMTQPYHMFRVASVSKPITAVTIMKLMEEGLLSMDDKVFGPGGIFENNDYFNSANITDDRIYDITVQHLLEHSGGWNRDITCTPNPTTPYSFQFNGCDPISFPLHVTETLGEPNPVTPEMYVKFLLEKGLQFAPGTSYAYSNIGYSLLGEIIEELTGEDYETYVKESILSPLGICDMHIGKSLLEDKRPREGEYGYPFSVLSSFGTGETVSWAYGGFNVEAGSAHGSWIASARDLVRLLVSVDGFNTKPDILTPATLINMTTPSANNAWYSKGWSVNPSSNWWHFGSLPGTASFMARTSGGYNWAIILNKRIEGAQSNAFWGDFDNLPWECLASTGSNPNQDLLATATENSSAITFSNVTPHTVDVSWTNGDGLKRILVARPEGAEKAYPLDGITYQADASFGLGDDLGIDNFIVFNDEGNSTTVTGLESNTTYHFQLYEYAQNVETGGHTLYLLCNSPSETVMTLMSTDVENQIQNHDLSLFPNPTNGQLNLNLENNWRGNIQLRIINILGQEVQMESISKDASSLNWSLNTEQLETGTYQLLLEQKGDVIVQTFVKQ